MFKTIGRSSNWIRRTSANTPTASTQSPASSKRQRYSIYSCLTNDAFANNHFAIYSSCTTTNHSYTQQTFGRNMSGETESPKFTNRLAQEKSPYLLQHAHNPVDWYPWCDEAIQLAKRENKVIFLSVGYSTCHWCHVMEHESFENEEIAKIMNENFINIKVDREERPDVDKIYMQFVLLMNGHGGWPMSVWLTPDLAPITAGTYFPPNDRWGMPSFTTVLRAIAKKWQNEEEDLRRNGTRVIAALRKSLSEKPAETTFEKGSIEAKLLEVLTIFKQRYDQQFGGFGTHPKFPEVSRLNFLFHSYMVTKDTDVLDMALQTLHKIGRGGIHDHIFGGFARYSVDRAWHVPHFEKMLYDQAQLMSAYANAYKITRNQQFMSYADGIFRYIMKDLRHPMGGFFAGEDADSLPSARDKKKIEGAFYAWTSDEIRNEISECIAAYPSGLTKEKVYNIYSYHYDIRPMGNVEPSSDPHGHLLGKNILIVRVSEEDTCTKFSITPMELQQILNITNEILHKLREKRPRPHLDTKIITSWNGLMLSGLSKLANCGSEKRVEYLKAARQLFDFIKKNLYDSERQQLFRSCYGVGTNDNALESVLSQRIYGFLDDYAFLIKGLHDYFKATLDADALKWSKQLQDVQDKLFWDEDNGAYYFSQADSSNLTIRLKSDHDGAEPGGNSVAARNLILLSHIFDDDSYRQRAKKLFQFFIADEQQPFGCTLPEMMCALMLNENGLDQVAIVGPETEETQKFIEICRKFYVPGMIILSINPQKPSEIYSRRLQDKLKMVQGKPTVYICHEKVCRIPITDPEKLEQELTENYLYKF